MAISIPTPLVEFILLGPQEDRRQLQDSPILGDVWVAYGENPGKRLDLLIAPFQGRHSGRVAAAIDDGIEYGDDDSASIAYLQGLVVAHLTFEEVLRVVVPKTKWWMDIVEKKLGRREKPEGESPPNDGEQTTEVAKTSESIQDFAEKAGQALKTVLGSASDWHLKEGKRRVQEIPSFDRFLALTGLIHWAGNVETPIEPESTSDAKISIILLPANVEAMSTQLVELTKTMLQDKTPEPLVWQVSLNRNAMPAVSRSIPAVKADAAKTLFNVDCSEIAWAVIDSGIDGSHPALQKENLTGSRVKRSFDFKNFRKIVSLSNINDRIREKNVKLLLEKKDDLKDPHDSEAKANDALLKLANDAKNQGPIHWELVEKFVEIKTSITPQTNHGTHVAGIIGASKKAAQAHAKRAAVEAAQETAKKITDDEARKIAEDAAKDASPSENEDIADGMCPDISLFDFRVLGPDMAETEFAIIAALQFIRYLNDRDNFLTIHGANLSLSIPHDVRNFACGRTPICNECERLVESGVVVVAAAGNHGYKSYETKDGSFDSYAAFSITDPGNADSVVTVGATHRYWPHTYGVSFFSSRGPTGDGRLKPDLVAPGERIRAPIPNGEWGDLDGTSMAAPHVSGAAAMLMARYSELIGQPRRIKHILCESATDLARERSFQGHGMLDVLRAFQSI